MDEIKDSVPISIGCIPVAITFGFLAKSYGIPDIIILLMFIVI